MADNNNIKTFASYSGADIHAVFGDKVFGEIQMISYKQDREKAPVYTMGSADLRTIARGKRLLTGACVFVMFDTDALLDAMNERDESFRPYINKSDLALRNNADEITRKSTKLAEKYGGSQFDQTFGLEGELEFNRAETADHLDQILPFDITIVGANEYGNVSKMIVKGVELMTEAGGMSVDDMVLEKQVSFIARRIEKWSSVANVAQRRVGKYSA